MKQPQYVFRPNLNDPQQRQAWAILEQIPSGQRKAFLVQAILATEQDDRLEKIIRKKSEQPDQYKYSENCRDKRNQNCIP